MPRYLTPSPPAARGPAAERPGPSCRRCCCHRRPLRSRRPRNAARVRRYAPDVRWAVSA